MKWVTHQTGALAAALALDLAPLSIGAALAGAVFPDVIDQSASRLGPTKKARQKIFNRIHRGPSHWFGWWLALFMGALGWLPHSYLKECCAGFLIGALSHIFMDMLTPAGVPVLPLSHKSRLSLNLCSTGHAGEYVFLAALIAFCAYMKKDFILNFIHFL